MELCSVYQRSYYIYIYIYIYKDTTNIYRFLVAEDILCKKYAESRLKVVYEN